MARDTKESVLEHLYNTLRQVSSAMSAGEFCGVPCSGTMRVFAACSSEGSISALAESLFGALAERFDLLMGGCGNAPSPWDEEEEEAQGANEFVLLLRCCIVLLRLLQFDHSLVMDRCRSLLGMIRKLVASVDGLSTLPGDFDGGGHRLKCALLEAFADELLMDENLEKHFRIADHGFDISKKLFLPYRSFQDNGAIFELICFHFMLCLNEKQFSKFHHSLYWSGRGNNGKPEVCLEAAVILLDTVVVVSAPQILMAHIILLACRCIGNTISPNDGCRNSLSLENILSAFNHSVNLYGYSLHRLCLKYDIVEIGNWSSPMKYTLESISRPSFAAYIRPATYCKVNDHIRKLHGLFNHISPTCSFTSDIDELNHAMAYVEENTHIVEQPYRTESLALLKHILSKIIFRRTRTSVFNSSGSCWEDMSCLATIMKLMSSSLLQIIRALRGINCPSEKTPKDFDSGKLYDTISETMSSFVQYNQDLLVESVTSDVMELYPTNCEKTKLMIIHFVGLLIYTLDSGIDYLWKSSIFIIITLLNLLIIEERSLDSVRTLFGFTEESSVQASLSIVPSVLPLSIVSLSSDVITQDQGYRRSSSIIASNYRKIYEYLQEKTVNLWVGTLTYNVTETHLLEGSHRTITDEASVGTSSIAANECGGQDYLACLGCKQADIDDLADFIVCEKGKTYSTWLKKRQKFRLWSRSHLEKRKRRKKYRKR